MERSRLVRMSVLGLLVFTGGCVFSRGAGLQPRWRADDAYYEDTATAEPAVASSPRTEPWPISDWRQIGTSVGNRPLRVRTVGEGARRVLWIGGIHGNEREGAVTTDRLPLEFGRTELGEEITLMILEDVNPDGSAEGTRHNANDVDLNRNFPAPNFDSGEPKYGGTPLSQPESRALHGLLLEWQPHLVIVSHSWSGRFFINYDGPAQALAADFAKLSGYPLVPSSSFATTPGSLGSYVGNTLGWPILTLEHLKGKDPIEAWKETSAAILSAIAGA